MKMGNCWANNTVTSYYPLWCLRDYTIDLVDKSNVQKSWASIAHHDKLYNSASAPPTPPSTTSHLGDSTSVTRGYHSYKPSVASALSQAETGADVQGTPKSETEAIATKVSFPVFHERFLMRFTDLHPAANIVPITEQAILLQFINVLVNGLQQSDSVFRSQIRNLVTNFNERGFRSAWYSTCGLCILATLREMCDTWSSDIEMSWIKSYSHAMEEIVKYVDDQDPAYSVQNSQINYRASGRNRRASIPSQIMQSYNLSNLRT